MKLFKGQFVEFDGLIAVVIGKPDDEKIPEGHVALWFGLPQVTRKSEGGTGGHKPQVHIVPIELCEKIQEPDFVH